MPSDEGNNFPFPYKRHNPYSHVGYSDLDQQEDRNHDAGSPLSIDSCSQLQFVRNIRPRQVESMSFSKFLSVFLSSFLAPDTILHSGPHNGSEYTCENNGEVDMLCDEDVMQNLEPVRDLPHQASAPVAPIFGRKKKISFVDNRVMTIQDLANASKEAAVCMVCGKNVANVSACYYCGKVACSDHIRKCDDCAEHFCYFCISLE